jgi:nephrocystin-3
MKPSPSRTARIFLSSTFRDFGEERDLLVRKVFPGLRARLKDRFVELVDVDLRWGITAEQAERGEVLPICLAEIDRSRPFFVGLLGERYGWIPPSEKYPAHVLEVQPWLEAHRGGKSVTELEILHGVLNDPKMAGRALFYFRSANYARKKGGDYVPASEEDARRQAELKERIRESGFPVVEDYADPQALAERLEADLWAVLDETFPAAEVPDAVAREAMRHEAYAALRRGLYLGGEAYLKALDEALASGKQWILIEGQSGGGKSALIANWTEALEKVHEDLVLHVHYLGATADASDPVSLVRRLVETIRRTVGSEEEVPGDPEKLLEALPLWLANASSWAGLKGKRFVIVIDALNGLMDRRDLRWFPSFLPERVHLVVSSLPGEVQDHLKQRAEWTEVAVKPLDQERAEELFVAYLRRFNKELPPDLVSRIMDHELVANPLFLRILAEELRLFGVHERLGERLEHYLTSKTVDDLFERVLERVEDDNGADTVRKVMVGLWASRAGLTEEEIRAWADLKPVDWAYIRNALGNALLEGSGRIVFGHDYLKIAVSDRYLSGNNTLDDEGQSPEAIARRQAAHTELAKWFEDHAFQPEDAPGLRVPDARAAEEIPHQWRQARDWQALKAALTQRDMFEAFYSFGKKEELLAHWVAVEQSGEVKIEGDYSAVWSTWNLDESTRDAANIASALQHFFAFAGQYGDFALWLAQFAQKTTEEVEGTEHPEVGRNLNNLAILLSRRGNYRDAEDCLQRAIKILEKASGSDNGDVAGCLYNLAQLETHRGNFISAEGLFRRALSIRERCFGSNSLTTIESVDGLAGILVEQGRFADAEPLFLRALSVTENAKGENHPDTGLCLNNLANYYISIDKDDLAEPLLRRSLEIAEKTLGRNHPFTAGRLDNYAQLAYSKGDLEEAEKFYRRALDIRERVLGIEHPDTGISLNNLGILLQSKGEYAEAEKMYRRDMAIAEKFMGPSHPDTAICLGNLGRLMVAKKDLGEAEKLFRLALRVQLESIGHNHPHTATTFSHLGSVLEQSGVVDEAKSSYLSALSGREESLGSEHASVMIVLKKLTDLLLVTGENIDAEAYLRRLCALQEKLLGLENSELLNSLCRLGDVLRRVGRHADAEKELAHALERAEKLDFAGPFFSFAELRIDQKRYEDAVILLQRCLRTHRRKLDPTDEAIGEVIRKLADVHRLMGRDAEAAEILKQLPTEGWGSS